MHKISDLPIFDASDFLDSEEVITEYLNVVLEENNPAELANALGVIAKARGMADIAKKSGISREALYHALRPNTQPRFETISKVCNALGVKLVAVPV